MRFCARAALSRAPWVFVLAAFGLALAGCSGSSPSSVTGPIGTSVGVTVQSSTGTTVVQQGGKLFLTASVTSDPTNAGVTWDLNGAGTLSEVTKSSATYTAPTGVVGSISPILNATSISDKSKTFTALLLVQGTPVIDPTNLFPGNVGSLYNAQISVSGGLGPYVWALASGTMPPGVTLGVSTTSFTTITGTPTTLGTYTFQIKVTDANKKTSSVDLSMQVKPLVACLLEGQYASVYNGYVSGQVAVGATSMTVASDGTITGYHDFNPGGTTISESVTGTCATRTSNNGTTQLIGAANSPVFNYAMAAGLINGRVQLINGGNTQAGSGPLEKQTTTDFVLSKLAGNFAFGALGSESGGAHMGVIGAVTIDASGNITAGHADSGGSNRLVNAALTGSLTAPSATTGRGTMTLTASGRTLHFSYYVVTADRLFIASLDPALPVAGFMTRQVGTFDNTSLSNPGILSLWGAAKVFQPKTVISLGRFSSADPGSGTINLLLDTGNLGTATFGQTLNAIIYAVRPSDGRTTMSYTSGNTNRNFVLYLDGPASGYVVEPDSSVGLTGLLEAQSPGPFSTTVPGLFVGATQFPQDGSPMVLMPIVHFAGSQFTSNFVTGLYSLDSNTGRGVGSLTVSGFPVSPLAFYIVRPDRVVALQMGTQYVNSVFYWLDTD